MASLRRHTLTSDPVAHLRLAFRADCPACRAARLSGPPPPDELLSTRARASLAAGLIAASTALPMSSAVAQGPRPVAGETQRVLPPGDVSDAAPAKPAAPQRSSNTADEPPALSAPEQVKPPAPATSAQPQVPNSYSAPRGPAHAKAPTNPEPPAAHAPATREQTEAPEQTEPPAQPDAPAQTEPPGQQAPSSESDAAPRQPVEPQATTPEPPKETPKAQSPPEPRRPEQPRTDAPAAGQKQEAQAKESPAGTERRTTPVTPSDRGGRSHQRQLPSSRSDAAAAVQGMARAHARAGSRSSGGRHESTADARPRAEHRSDRASGSSTGARPSGAAAADVRAHVVRPGESLWLIAEHYLGDGASNARIAAEVARLWERNAGRIATGNPDLIYPGQELRL